MVLARAAIRNALRNKTRTALTVLAGASAVVAFVLFRTIPWAWNVGVQYATQDRLGTRNKISHTVPLPRRYVDVVRQVPGIRDVGFIRWFGGKLPARPDDSFSSFAADARIFDVYDELSISPDDRHRWEGDRRGAVVGDLLARKLGLRVGDTVTLTGTLYPGDWQFNIDGVYQARRRTVDRSQFIFHWEYLNDSLPERWQNQVGWIVARIDDVAHSADICAAVDRKFDESDVPTTTMNERAINLSFLATLSAVLRLLDVVSLAVLLISTLVLGNSLAMSVRERASEYGLLRALGFSSRQVFTYVLLEASAVAIAAAALGLALSYPVVEHGAGPWLEENVGEIFPYFRMNGSIAALAFVLPVGLSLLAALLPAWSAARLAPVHALRHVD